MFIGLPTTSMSKGPKGFDSPDASAKPPYFIPASTPPGAVRGKLYTFFFGMQEDIQSLSREFLARVESQMEMLV